MGKCGLGRIVGDFRVQRLIEGLRIKQGMGLFHSHTRELSTQGTRKRGSRKSPESVMTLQFRARAEKRKM